MLNDNKYEIKIRYLNNDDNRIIYNKTRGERAREKLIFLFVPEKVFPKKKKENEK